MKGQMTIFDFPEWLPEEKPNDFPCNGCRYDTVTGSCGYDGDGYCVLGDKREEKAPAEIWSEETGVSDYWQHDIKFIDDKPVCKHSGHSCNRIELWKVADTLDGITCSKTCCRQCSISGCGARCNGSEEPKINPKLDIPKAPIWHYSLNHVWEECPNCKAYNKASVWTPTWDHRDGFWKELERCPECGQLFNWSDEAIEKAAKYSKDYLDAQRRQYDNTGTIRCD